MKNLSITLAVIFLSIVFLFSLKTYRDFVISSDLKNDEKNKLKTQLKSLMNVLILNTRLRQL